MPVGAVDDLLPRLGKCRIDCAKWTLAGLSLKNVVALFSIALAHLKHQLAAQVPPFADAMRLGGVGQLVARNLRRPHRTAREMGWGLSLRVLQRLQLALEQIRSRLVK